MILTAIGAAASAPKPPPLTMTPTAIFGLLAGAKQVKTASSRLVALTPFSAVPVLPAISTPATDELAVANAVPAGFWVTSIIICVILPATCGVVTCDSTDGLVFWMVVKSGACTCCTRYGGISLPWLAIAAASMASCRGVTSSSSWPIAVYAVSDLSVISGTTLGETFSGIVRFESFQPNLVA